MSKFQLYLEAVQVMNSDKEVKLTNYKSLVQTYNAKKNNLKQIFTQDPAKWEDLANKIIMGNIYLGIYWKVAKIEQSIKSGEDKLKTGQFTQDENTGIKTELENNKKLLIDAQKELDEKIRKDLNTIQSE